MKYIKENITEKVCDSNLWDFYFQGMNVGVLDIETTGLKPAVNKFVLGCVTDDAEGVLYQMLAETRREEKETLIEYMKQVSKMDVIVTYNGRHFDVPFLRRRLEEFTLGRNVYMPYNLDLYLVVNGYSSIRQSVPNLKQKTLENYMGFWMDREDEISGAESVELYNLYEKTKDPDAKRRILLHNNDDVRQLTRLTSVTSKCDFHRAMYGLGFPVKPVKDEMPIMNVEKIRVNKDFIIAEGIQSVKDGQRAVEYRSFPMGSMSAETRFSSRKRDFEIKIPIMRQSGVVVTDILEVLGDGAEEFKQYPLCENGFLAVEDRQGLKYRELNHLVKAVIRSEL